MNSFTKLEEGRAQPGYAPAALAEVPNVANSESKIIIKCNGYFIVPLVKVFLRCVQLLK